MPKTTALSAQAGTTSPDYVGLLYFLLQPFLEFPDSLSVDCEQSNNNKRVWLRVAFGVTEKGRVFGRGGRNIQAIKKVLETAAVAAGQSLYLDIHGTHASTPPRSDDSRRKPERTKQGTRRLDPPKPSVKPRPQLREN
ncbi:MAG: KH domain-containing protein [Moorea sp. SIO2B7]|nr:KH domain-containing protein [Moorena sp. SIO2B7]